MNTRLPPRPMDLRVAADILALDDAGRSLLLRLERFGRTPCPRYTTGQQREAAIELVGAMMLNDTRAYNAVREFLGDATLP